MTFEHHAGCSGKRQFEKFDQADNTAHRMTCKRISAGTAIRSMLASAETMGARTNGKR